MVIWIDALAQELKIDGIDVDGILRISDRTAAMGEPTVHLICVCVHPFIVSLCAHSPLR
jgi:hypothetical protein